MPARRREKKGFPWVIVLISLAVLAVIGLGVRAGLSSTATGAEGYPKAISPQQVQTEQATGAILLDVRERDEYTQSHISGSLWIPLGELSSRLQELPSGRLIIVVCRTGVRAAQGRDILLAAGYSRVTSMSGGLQAWMAAGLPVESGPPPNP
jgi:rhodanese-related sulfurtransferase